MNEVSLTDTPWQNPYDDAPGSYEIYLTTKSVTSEAEPSEGKLFNIRISLADTKLIKARIVYNIITLVSEISGFADILIVFVSFVLGLIYTPRMLEAALLRHMGPVELPSFNKQREDPEEQPDPVKL